MNAVHKTVKCRKTVVTKTPGRLRYEQTSQLDCIPNRFSRRRAQITRRQDHQAEADSHQPGRKASIAPLSTRRGNRNDPEKR